MEDEMQKNPIPLTRLSALRGVGKAREAAYAKIGLETVGDLLRFYPRAYENRGDIRLLADAEENCRSAVVLTVSTQPRVARIRRDMTLLKFTAFDDSGVCHITFFNQEYLKEQFPIGSVFRFWGKVERNGNAFAMTSPIAEPYAEGVPLRSLVPVYRLSEGLTQKQIAANVAQALEMYRDPIEVLPEDLRVSNRLCTAAFALRQIHNPESYAALLTAKKRMAYEECFFFSLALGRLGKGKPEETAFPCTKSDPDALYRLLPYTPTDDQKTAIADIARDMAKKVPMKRLVVGDVGCGKTLCAAAALLIALQNGRQAVLMAPTEILATQHFHSLQPLFANLGFESALLIGATPEAEKKKIRARLASPDEKARLPLVIGTQALLSEGVAFSAPGVIVTDEQHRFGVRQRAALAEKNGFAHMLVMSATPIPRSLALVLYGDLDVSRIRQMPAGRERVDTFVADETMRARLDAFIAKQALEGGQVYIVCPAVEEDEESGDEIELSEMRLGADPAEAKPEKPYKPPLKAAVAYADDLQKRLPHLRIAFVHGKMKGKEKDAVMASFAAGQIDVLVSTTVIEVGVNVPNATLMLVENAERFGLSQLHQLRGRVGRGNRKSYCVLVTEATGKLGETAKKRLETMKTTYDGYAIAEQDLLLRGPGEFLPAAGEGGIKQSGIGISSLCDDAALMEAAFRDAGNLLKADRDLSSHPLLAARVDGSYGIGTGLLN